MMKHTILYFLLLLPYGIAARAETFGDAIGLAEGFAKANCASQLAVQAATSYEPEISINERFSSMKVDAIENQWFFPFPLPNESWEYTWPPSEATLKAIATIVSLEGAMGAQRAMFNVLNVSGDFQEVPFELKVAARNFSASAEVVRCLLSTTDDLSGVPEQLRSALPGGVEAFECVSRPAITMAELLQAGGSAAEIGPKLQAVSAPNGCGGEP